MNHLNDDDRHMLKCVAVLVLSLSCVAVAQKVYEDDADGPMTPHPADFAYRHTCHECGALYPHAEDLSQTYRDPCYVIEISDTPFWKRQGRPSK